MSFAVVVTGVILVDYLQSSQSIQTLKFFKGCYPRDYHWPMKSNRAFVQNLGNGYFCRCDVRLPSKEDYL